MKRKLLAIALFGAAFASAFGQQKEPAAPTIKRRAELVLVPAVVTQDGQPIRGLTAKDFTLLHNGQPESVDVFEEIDATPAKVAPVALPPRTVRNYASADSRQDVVILVLDYLNSSFSTRARIHSFLGDMMREFTAARTPVSIFLLSRDGLLQMQSFTNDLADLAKAIERWQSGKIELTKTNSQWESPFAETAVEQTDTVLSEIERYRDLMSDRTLRRAEMTADAIEHIAEAYRGVPGRKKLIWMSTGFPLAVEDVFEDVTSTRLQLESKIADRQMRAWKALSNTNIAVYTIDSSGVVNPSWERAFSPQVSGEGHVKGPERVVARPPPFAESSNNASLRVVAEKTGGRNCTEAPHKCVGKALADGTHYYVLGFYLHGENKPGWHKLKVSLSESKAAVRARDGFVIDAVPSGKPAAVKEKDKDEVMTALASPLDYTSIPLRLSWSPLPGQGKEMQVELALFSPPGGVSVDPEDSRVNLDYLAFIRPVGKTEAKTFPASLTNKLGAAELDILVKAGFRFRKQVPLPPGRYEVRVFLRDNIARKIGTVSTMIDLSSTLAPASNTPKP